MYTKKKYEEINTATVYAYCSPMKHSAFPETVRQYMIIIETEGEEKFEFVPTCVINQLL